MVEEVSVGRVMLHAARLVLPHPATGASLAFEAPVPPDFAELAERLGCPVPDVVPDVVPGAGG
jgi:23S rRNA pseudouridine1911/1915/1917 synthase